jgi:3-oxoacyl-[acyl-carrier-protein] synthase-3
MTIRRSTVAGIGHALPKRVVTNSELAAKIDTSDEWIVERTGIRQRHIAGEGETTASLATLAAQDALSHAGLKASDIDLIVLATATPDLTFPATATQVQAALGMTQGAAFDIQAVCSGFVYAVSIADKFLQSGSHQRALVIGSETFSRILDWNDRTTCVLFGDGAGAVFLRGVPAAEAEGRGLLSTHMHADGRHADILQVDGGAGSTGGTGVVRMAGREVFKHAVAKLAAAVDEALAANGLDQSEVAWLVPHQANIRIIEAMGKKLGLPLERVVVTVDRHANTSAASIPLALAEATRDGRIRPGDLVLLEAIGGGLTWGAALARF